MRSVMRLVYGLRLARATTRPAMRSPNGAATSVTRIGQGGDESPEGSPVAPSNPSPIEDRSRYVPRSHEAAKAITETHALARTAIEHRRLTMTPSTKDE